jgi:hypothetical protein
MSDAGRSLILAASLALVAFTPRYRTPRPAASPATPPSATATFPFVYDDGRVFIPVRLAHDTAPT